MNKSLSIVLRSFILMFFITISVSVDGAYMENHPTTLHNLDVSKLQCFATGDEYFRVVHDKDDYSILLHPKTGYAVYAVQTAEGIVASDYRVGSADPLSLGTKPHLWSATKGLKAEIERENRLQMENRISPVGQINSLVVSNVGASEADQISFELSISTEFTVCWTGNGGTSWHNPANWSSGAVPTANDNVVIPSNLRTYPSLSGRYGICRDLRIEHGARISLNQEPLFVYHNAEIMGSLSFNLPGSSFNVAGDLRFWSSSMISRFHGGGFLTVGGNLRFESGSDIRIAGSTLQLSGETSAELINNSVNTELGYLHINKGPRASVTLSEQSTAALKIMNNFTLASGQSLIIENEQVTQFYGNITDQNVMANRGIQFNDGTARMAGVDQSITFSSTNSYFHHLDINSSQATSLLSNVRVKGELKVVANSGLDIGANALYIGGDWTVHSGANLDITDSTVFFDGVGDQNVSGTDFNTLRLAKSTGNLIFSSGATVVNSFKYDLGTLVVNGASLFLNDLADYSIQGNYVVQSGELNFAQDSSSHLDLDCNLNISGGSVILSGGIDQPIEIAYSRHSSLTISGGTLDFGNHDLLIADSGYNLNLAVSGGLIRCQGSVQIIRPNVQFAEGVFELYGTADKSISMSAGSSFYDLKINKYLNRSDATRNRSNTLNMASDLCVENDLILSWGYLSVNNYQLHVGRDVYTEFLSGLIMTETASAVQISRNLDWQSDANSILDCGYLMVHGNWTQHPHASLSCRPLHIVSFIGSGPSTISSSGNSLTFGNLLVDKQGAGVSLDAGLQVLSITGFLQIEEDSSLDFAAGSTSITGNFILNGSISGASGGSVNCQNLTLNGNVELPDGFSVNTLNLNLNGQLLLAGGDMIVSNEFVQSMAAVLTIDNGQFILDKAYTGAMFPVASMVNLNGGYFQVSNNGILLGPGSQLHHNGGCLRIGWNFQVLASGSFRPSQGAVEFIGNRHSRIIMPQANHFYDLVVNKSSNMYAVYMMNNRDVANDLYIQQGYFVMNGMTLNIGRNMMLMGGMLYADDFMDVINVGKNWSNSAGANAFIEGSGTVNLVSNQDAVLSGDIFHNLNINKAGSTVTLTQGADVAVNGLLQVQNGSLQLNTGSSLAALGILSILDGSGLNMQPPSGTAELRVHGNVIDQNAVFNEQVGLFTGVNSRIIFAGSNDQELSGGYSNRDFYQVLVQKTGGAVLPHYGTLVKDEFRVISGEWSLAQAGISREFQGDFIIELNGVFSTGYAPVIFSGNSSTMQIAGQATIRMIHINKNEGESLSLVEDVVLSGTTTIILSSGIFSLGGHQLQMLGNLSITDLMLLPAGSSLSLLSGSTVSIGSGGKFLAFGSIELPVIVSSPNGYYGFCVREHGSLGGQWCVMEKMNATGIEFSLLSALNADHPPTNFTFSDGESGGSLLRISWEVINANTNTFYNAHFPANTWGSLSNVRKGNFQGSVRFENAFGGFSGEAFEDDEYSTIHWIYSAPPAPPENVQISLLTDSVQISWDAVDDADAYAVYRSYSPDDPISWESIGETEDTFYGDESIIVYDKAFYRVRAIRY